MSRLTSSPSTIYLDIGCCFGQDLRQLVADGVPSSQLIGLDIESQLIELGYEFFLDRATLRSKFIVADVFKGAAQGALWTELEELKADIIHASAFFHLFPLADQVRAAKNTANLVRMGGVIVGRQSGSVKPSEVPAIKAGTTSFRHDVNTFQRMWDEVGEATGTKWSVNGILDEVGMKGGKNTVEDENSRRMLFTVTRGKLMGETAFTGLELSTRLRQIQRCRLKAKKVAVRENCLLLEDSSLSHTTVKPMFGL